MSTPDLSTLPARMYYAAEVLKEASHYYHSLPENRHSNWTGQLWSSSQLRNLADDWEAEEEAAAEQRRMVELLVADMCKYGKYLTLQNRIDCARDLIAAGWTKAPL